MSGEPTKRPAEATPALSHMAAPEWLPEATSSSSIASTWAVPPPSKPPRTAPASAAPAWAAAPSPCAAPPAESQAPNQNKYPGIYFIRMNTRVFISSE